MPPAPAETTVSPDGLLTAKVDAARAGVFLLANFAGDATAVPPVPAFDPLPQKVRFVRGDGTLVRSGDPAWAPGGIAIAYDHEAPIGTPASYTAVPLYRDGSEGAATAGVTALVPWVADASDVWLKSPIDPNRSVVARAATFEEAARPLRNAGTAVPGARLGVFSYDVTGGLTAVLTVKTDTRAEYDALVHLFEAGPILLQANPACSGIAQMYAMPSGDLLSLRRVATGYGWGMREWPITLTECRRPATLDSPLRVPGNSYADTDPDFPTYADATATGTTYLEESFGDDRPTSSGVEIVDGGNVLGPGDGGEIVDLGSASL